MSATGALLSDLPDDATVHDVVVALHGFGTTGNGKLLVRLLLMKQRKSIRSLVMTDAASMTAIACEQGRHAAWTELLDLIEKTTKEIEEDES